MFEAVFLRLVGCYVILVWDHHWEQGAGLWLLRSTHSSFAGSSRVGTNYQRGNFREIQKLRVATFKVQNDGGVCLGCFLT